MWEKKGGNGGRVERIWPQGVMVVQLSVVGAEQSACLTGFHGCCAFGRHIISQKNKKNE